MQYVRAAACGGRISAAGCALIDENAMDRRRIDQ